MDRLKQLGLATLMAITWLLAGGACAYHPGFGDRQIPGGYRTVAVPVFKNNTHETGIEVYFTNAFIREMQRSRIGLLTDKDAAQTTVEGVVEGVAYVPGGTVSGNGTNFPAGIAFNQSYQIVITSTVRLRRNSDQKILWEGSFSKEAPYRAPQVGYEPLTGVNALYNHSAHYQNFELIAADMMTEAHDRLTENF